MRRVYPSDVSVQLFLCHSVSTDLGRSVTVFSSEEVSVTFQVSQH